MKKTKLNLILFLSILFMTSYAFVININASTTIRITTVGVNQGEVLTWKVTEVGETITNMSVGDKIEETIKAINSSSGYLRVYITSRYYNSTSGNWVEIFTDPQEILAYNASTNNLNRCIINVPPILPISLNLTMFGEFINSTSVFEAIVSEIDITIFNLGGTLFYLKFNNEGKMKSGRYFNAFNFMFELVLEKKSETSIPFGMMFLAFGTIGILALVSIVKKKSNYVK